MKKRLHLDLANQDACKNLKALCKTLEAIKKGQTEPESQSLETKLDIASQKETRFKLMEMQGKSNRFQVTEFAPGYDHSDSAVVADAILTNLSPNGIQLIQLQDLKIITFPTHSIVYNSTGRIVSEGDFYTQDILHYLACHIKQDIALVLNKNGKFIYSFDSSMYEKTPKDMHTGKNRFLGKDFLEFHSKATTYGYILGDLLQGLIDCFESTKIDLLTIDLLGSNQYRYGSKIYQRFERDHVVPIFRQMPDGRINLFALFGYADVFFRPENEDRSPYQGGKYIRPVGFHNRAEVIERA